jgi:hypothetical protein
MKPKLIGLGLAAGLMLASGSAFAQDRYYDRQDLRRDYAQANRLRADIARDQYRLDQAQRRGDWRKAEAIRRDLDRDRRALAKRDRDIRHDRRDLRYDNGWR